MHIEIKDFNITGYQWWLWIHNRSEHMSDYEWNSDVNIKRHHQYEFAYRVRSYQLLPSPYRTDCIDYSKTILGVNTRKDCIRKCKLRQSLNKCGVVSEEINVYDNEPNVRFAKTNEEVDCHHDLHLDRYCLAECSRYDCFKQYIETKTISDTTFDDMKLYSTIRIFLPDEPRTVLMHKSNIALVEFLCYSGFYIEPLVWFLNLIPAIFDQKFQQNYFANE